MPNLYFSAEDLVQTRFAYSSLWETAASYRMLKKPASYPLHLPWIRQAEPSIQRLDMHLLEALMLPSGNGHPDFLTPPPTTPMPNLEKELKQLVKTPARTVYQDIENLIKYDDGQGNNIDIWLSGVAPFLDNPTRSLEALADSLWQYWQQTLEPHWPRIQALLEADIMYRAKALALYGPERVFNDFSSIFSYRERTLSIKKHHCFPNDIDLTGRGLLLIPSVFISHTLLLDPPWQETLQYGARGTAGLWCPEPVPTTEALTKLLGDTRAKLLKQLLTPSTTSQLAALFRVSPSAISQHLSWLRETGLATTQRHGKHVYYKLSPIAEGLLASYGELETGIAQAV